jgi:hypothetical protein
MGSPERYSSFAMGVSPLEKKPEPPAGSIVMGLRASHFQKPLGYRADREPDASWHRPSYHKPPEHEREYTEEERERAFRTNPYLVDMFAPPEEEPEPPSQGNKPQGRRCIVGNNIYFISADNKTIRSLNGAAVTEEIKRRCGVISK